MTKKARKGSQRDPGQSHARKRSGRPKQFDSDALRDVWVHIVAVAEITKRPILQASKKAKFCWLMGGSFDVEARKRDLDHVHHQAFGETLRRRYYEAERFLAYERQIHQRLHGPKAKSPTEVFWRKLVEEKIIELQTGQKN